MPTFGSFDTVGEPVAVSEESGHVSTVWRAQKTGGGSRFYAIKCYLPQRSATAIQVEGALARDRGLEYLEGVKEIKRAGEPGESNLAPIYEFGTSEHGAWYATAFYPGGELKAWIDRRGGMDSAALRHIIHCVVSGCLELKRSRGHSHGNLKPSNVFLGGPAGRLSRRPIFLTDAAPAAPGQLAQLPAADRGPVGRLLTEVVEAQDLRAIGELVLQLVERRLLASSEDYNFPLSRSAAWDALGKQGEAWLRRCNQLIDPRISLQSVNLEGLERELRLSAFEKATPVLRITSIGTVLAVVGVLLVSQGIERWRRSRFEGAMAAAIKSLKAPRNAANLLAARTDLEKALRLQPQNTNATGLEQVLREKSALEYEAEMQAGAAELTEHHLDAASNHVSLALLLLPGGKEALDLQSQVAQVFKKYADTLERARKAYRDRDYVTAGNEINLALRQKPEAEEALKLKTQIQQEGEKNHEAAASAAKKALERGMYDEAIKQALIGLKIQTNDITLSGLLKQAEEKKVARENYDKNMAQGQKELAAEQYEQAATNFLAAYQAAAILNDSQKTGNAGKEREYSSHLLQAYIARNKRPPDVRVQSDELKEAQSIHDTSRIRGWIATLTTNIVTTNIPSIAPRAVDFTSAKVSLTNKLYMDASNSFVRLLQTPSISSGDFARARSGTNYTGWMLRGMEAKAARDYPRGTNQFGQAKGILEWSDSHTTNAYEFCNAMIEATNYLAGANFTSARRALQAAHDADSADTTASDCLTFVTTVMSGDSNYYRGNFELAQDNFQAAASSLAEYRALLASRLSMSANRAEAGKLMAKPKPLASDFALAAQKFAEVAALEKSLQIQLPETQAAGYRVNIALANADISKAQELVALNPEMAFKSATNAVALSLGLSEPELSERAKRTARDVAENACQQAVNKRNTTVARQWHQLAQAQGSDQKVLDELESKIRGLLATLTHPAYWTNTFGLRFVWVTGVRSKGAYVAETELSHKMCKRFCEQVQRDTTHQFWNDATKHAQFAIRGSERFPDDLPITLSWQEAQQIVDALNRRSDLRENGKYEMPTREDFLCFVSTNSAFTNALASSKDLKNDPQVRKELANTNVYWTSIVANCPTFRGVRDGGPNDAGLFNVIGNAWEWSQKQGFALGLSKDGGATERGRQIEELADANTKCVSLRLIYFPGETTTLGSASR